MTNTRPRTLARDTEGRLDDAILDAISPYLGEQTAREMIEEHAITREPPGPEGMVAKLDRMQSCTAGQEWLESHPNASWDEIVAAKI